MTIIREQIYEALFELVNSAAQFTTAERRLRHWSDVSPAEQPAVFTSEKGGHAVSKAYGTPQVWTLLVDLYVYVHSSDPYRSPAMVLNPLLDAIEAAVAPNPNTGIQNLGLPSMVQHVRIEGKLETDEGVLGDQAVAVIPVEILCI